MFTNRSSKIRCNLHHLRYSISCTRYTITWVANCCMLIRSIEETFIPLANYKSCDTSVYLFTHWHSRGFHYGLSLRRIHQDFLQSFRHVFSKIFAWFDILCHLRIHVVVCYNLCQFRKMIRVPLPTVRPIICVVLSPAYTHTPYPHWKCVNIFVQLIH